jgi:hypothetical protein
MISNCEFYHSARVIAATHVVFDVVSVIELFPYYEQLKKLEVDIQGTELFIPEIAW